MALLDEELKGLPEKSDEAPTLATYIRLLHVIADHREDAVRAIEQLPDEEQEYWKHQIVWVAPGDRRRREAYV